MTTPRRRRTRVTARLRAIAGLPARRRDDDKRGRTRVTTVSYVRSHRDLVWVPPEPTRRWFEQEGIEKADQTPLERGWRRWFT